MSEPAPESENDNAGVRVPPPLIYIAVLAFALVFDLAIGGPRIGTPLGIPNIVRIAAGVALFLIGMLLGGRGLALFRLAGTEVRPWMPSTALVTSGIYRFTRNPMYLGLTLCYAGLSLLADSAIALLCLIPLLVIITYGVIKREEHYLEVKFGEDYREYKGKVRRWI